MNITNDRRAPGTTRIPFDALVEVGGALGPSFEAQAVNVSGEGMSLRTAYLPEIGQPVTCRFDSGRGASVVAAGEVVWNDERGDGGEFGIRFTKLDANGVAQIQRMLGVTSGAGANGAGTIGNDGRKIRLHIDGLASPMRARAKGPAQPERVKAFSELGFLQLGRSLDVEDAATGRRRPASVDRVDVEIQPESRVPQLVVSLRYEDEEARAAAMAIAEESPVVSIAAPYEAEDESATEDEAAYASGADDDDATFGEDDDEDLSQEGDFADDDQDPFEDEVRAADPIRGSVRVKFDSTSDEIVGEGDDDAADFEDASPNIKERLAAAAGKIAPAVDTVERWASRAKNTAVLVAQRALARKAKAEEARAPQRRTTAPAPSGGLHTSGRKVVRGAIAKEPVAPAKAKKLDLPVTKKHMVIGGSTALAVLIAALAFRSPDKPEPVAIESVSVETTTPAALPAAVEPAVVEPAAVIAATPPAPIAPRPRNAPVPVDDSMVDEPAPVRKKVAAAPAPFGSGRVGSGNILRLKMDGDIERIHGASQPTGFTVVLPRRKSLEPAAPLASRDPRIASMKVLNEEGGAELSVSFKDGVPNYLVRAKGDTLEIVLARAGQSGERAPEAHVTKKKTSSTTTRSTSATTKKRR